MAFPADPSPHERTRSRVLEQLRERLELVEALSTEVRGKLRAGDASGVDASTARLETVAQEFKVLAEEYQRSAPPERHRDADPTHARARQAFQETAARLARSSAIAGGLLERMVALSRGVMALWAGRSGESYLPSGQAPDLAARGIRLKEWV